MRKEIKKIGSSIGIIFNKEQQKVYVGLENVPVIAKGTFKYKDDARQTQQLP